MQQNDFISVAEACNILGFCRQRFWQLQARRRCFEVKYLNASRAIVSRRSVEAFAQERNAYVGKYPSSAV